MSKKTEKEARRILDNDHFEFYRTDTADIIVNVYNELVHEKVKDATARSVIQTIWDATRQEYGE